MTWKVSVRYMPKIKGILSYFWYIALWLPQSPQSAMSDSLMLPDTSTWPTTRSIMFVNRLWQSYSLWQSHLRLMSGLWQIVISTFWQALTHYNSGQVWQCQKESSYFTGHFLTSVFQRRDCVRYISRMGSDERKSKSRSFFHNLLWQTLSTNVTMSSNFCQRQNFWDNLSCFSTR